ncbi:hypothetical protein AWC38_SpisGene23158 [Stylophora pistillata]|uniref:DDE Tnp4 domain-containing protein n=1 Tax=Stylophora pistillata TaxID=50429 RepID=A0A2B4R7L3_STYPI|nr:hypothetical protein AWC38_SpisGene23158 [Stylophora pistillata]
MCSKEKSFEIKSGTSHHERKVKRQKLWRTITEQLYACRSRVTRIWIDRRCHRYEGYLNESTIDEDCNTMPHVYENSTGKLVSDRGSQTLYSEYELSAKVETMILKNDVATRKPHAPKILMYVTFRDMQQFMFPQRAQPCRFLPKVFKTMRKIRCIVDCTEFRVERSRNFARQGNTFFSYKHTNTFKRLIAVTPNGGACFVSNLFEGDIDDVAIFKESGLMKHLKPYDLVLADRGFTVRELLSPLHVKLEIPSFMKERKNLSTAEELETRHIATAGIHVERFNEHLKSDFL